MHFFELRFERSPLAGLSALLEANMSVSESRLACTLKSAASVAAWSVVAVTLLASGTLAISWFLSLFRDGTFTRGDNVVIGLVCCLIVLLFIGAFHLRKETAVLRFADRAKFLSRMHTILVDLGYQAIDITEDHWRTRPHFRALLFGDGIDVKLEGGNATLTGPRWSLERIRRRYRMASQLDKVQESISDSKARVAETFLKRLELSVRLEPNHLEEFQKRIVDVLAKNGNVMVDVQLMLISENGMNESLWSNDMRPWLDENEIPYEFHRDRTQRATIAAAAGDRPDTFVDMCTWS
jgi:hypothetical protein